MATLDKLVGKITTDLDSNFRLAIDPDQEIKIELEAAEILFHLPLMTLIILVVSSRPTNQLSVESAAHWVARVLMEPAYALDWP